MPRKAKRAFHIRASMAAAVLFVSTVVVGCAGQTELTNVWKDPSFTSGPVHNVFVVAVRKDPVRRRMWEDAFVKGLNVRGVTATPSYRLFPAAPPDTQEVIETVRKNGYDAVLASTRLPYETTSRYVPGAVRAQQVTSQDYYGRFHSYWVNVQDPGYTETDKIIRIQTDVWGTRADSGQLVWSGTLRAFESLNGRSVDAAVAKNILPRLEKQGVVPEKTK